MKKELEMIEVIHASQSIDEWAREIVTQYHEAVRRPEAITLRLTRYGECYLGRLYISKEDFDARRKA